MKLRLYFCSTVFLLHLCLWSLPGITISVAHAKRKHPNFTNSDDYYTVLGVPRTATTKEIKSAYRKLALRYHPDKVPEDEKDKSEEVFVRVSEAYSILSDDEKRKVYDKYGKQGLEMMERGMDPEQSAGGGGFPGFDGFTGGHGRSSFQTHFQHTGGSSNFQFDPFTMFEEMFKGSGGFQQASGNGSHQKFHNFGGFPHSSASSKSQESVDPFQGLKGITKLSSAKFPNKSSRYLWLIVFYDGTSSATRSVIPELKVLLSKQSGLYKIGALNCAKAPQETRFCRQHGVMIENHPTIGFVVDGQCNFWSGQITTLTAKQLHDFATGLIPTKDIRNINHSQHVLERLVEPLGGVDGSSYKAAILLLSDKYETGPIFASLAYQYKTKFLFGESRASNLSLSREFGLKKYPMLIALVPRGYGERSYGKLADRIVYTNSHDMASIKKWLDQLDRKLPVSKQKNSRERRSNHAGSEL